MTRNPRISDPDSEAVIPTRAPDCLRCGHFKITWEPALPRSCALFGIKCRNLPSMEVFFSTGKHCFAFERKAGLSPSSHESE